VRDAWPDRAIEAAGGVAQLARKIGIAQPTVSNWNRVPEQRVIAGEAATGVSRKFLRPDLYSELAPEDGAVDPIDAAHSQEYALLATLLLSALGCDELMFPFYVSGIDALVQMVHSVVAVLFVAAMLAHIYIGTIGMEGAFEAMGSGTVDVNWAKKHHSLWLEEENARGMDDSG
jgi:DNA-binding transcriptional regulator YdaS (Cro superfamily)